MLQEKIEEIKQRLSLNNKELAYLLDVKMNELINTNEEKLLSRLTEIFEINTKDLHSNPLPKTLKITKNLDIKKYKNRVNAYNEIIKKNYSSKWKIYVLTKTKTKQKFTLSTLFRHKKTKNYTPEFTPSFLATTNNTRLLINFKKDTLIIQELAQNIDENTFIINNIKYKKANEINI